MSDFPSIGFDDAATIEAIPLPVWRQLLDAVGYPDGLSATALDYLAIRAALARRALPDALGRALQTIHDLSTDVARETLFEAVDAEGVDSSQWQDAPPAELVARLCVEAQNHETINRALRRTQLSVYEARVPRAVKEFAGRSPRDLDPAAGSKALERGLGKWFSENGMGDHVEVSATEADDEVRFVIVHGRRIAAPLVVGTQGRVPLPHRPVQCDLLRYQPSSGRLKVSAPYPKLVRRYREAAGVALFNDPAFFENETACSLFPLREHGATALTHHTCAEIDQARLTKVVWRTPEGDKCTFTSDDCFALMERLNLRLDEGAFLEAHIAIKFYGRPPNRVTATLREPNYLDYPDPDGVRSAQIEGFLAELGLWQAERARSGRDLWELSGGTHPREAWRIAFGHEADRMIREKLLLPARLAAVAESDHPDGAAVVDVVATDDDPPFLGVSRTPGTVGRPLSPTDIQGFELSLPNVARLLAQELGLEGVVTATVAEGLFDLGRRTLGGTIIRVFLAMREPGAAAPIAQIIQTPEKSVVLVPKGRVLPAGYPVAELAHILPRHDDTVRAIIHTLHLEDQVDAVLVARPEDRLVVDSQARRAWLDGTELVELKDQPFEFVEKLVAAAKERRTLSTAEIEAKLSNREAAARQAKARAIRAIKKSFEKAERSLPKDLDTIFETQRRGNGWRLTVPFFLR